VRPALRLGAALLGLALASCGDPEEPVRLADPESLRTTTEGPVLGFEGPDASHGWLGLRYAAAPVGELRWKAPRPPSPHTGVLSALADGSPCPQMASDIGVPGRSGSVVGAEDCLFLNVWAPRFARAQVPQGKDRLPVMVWIHGGGNTLGTGNTFVGSRLASSQRVLVVSFNYRLGPLGWFRHAALRSASTDPREASGNYGTLDLIQALTWVRDNASAFGGDPERVTIFGESSGGVNVFSLLVSPLARGLFQRAIVQSGGAISFSIAEAENLPSAKPAGRPGSSAEIVLRLLEKTERAGDRGEAVALADRMPRAELAALLHATTPEDLIDLYPKSIDPFLDVPTVLRDGHVVPEESLEKQLRRPSSLAQVPLLMGTNRDETRVFQFGAGIEVRRWFWLIPRVKNAELYERLAYYTSGIWKAMGADEIAAALVRGGASDVWVYRFDWDEQPNTWVGNLPQLIGASHGFEIPFVFGRFDLLGPFTPFVFNAENEPGRLELASAMMSYWAQFAAQGDPGKGRAGDLPPWERWNETRPDAPRFMILDTSAGGGLRMSSQSVTQADLLNRMKNDPVVSAEVRCAMMTQIVGMQQAQVSDLAVAGCPMPDGTMPVAAGAPGGR
jgi:para-nitrobenzyl esterase